MSGTVKYWGFGLLAVFPLMLALVLTVPAGVYATLGRSAVTMVVSVVLVVAVVHIIPGAMCRWAARRWL